MSSMVSALIANIENQSSFLDVLLAQRPGSGGMNAALRLGAIGCSRCGDRLRAIGERDRWAGDGELGCPIDDARQPAR